MHQMCQGCVVDFLYTTARAKCPLCNGALNAGAQLCYDRRRSQRLLEAARFRCSLAGLQIESGLDEFVRDHVPAHNSESEDSDLLIWARPSDDVSEALRRTLPQPHETPVMTVSTSTLIPTTSQPGDVSNAALNWQRVCPSTPLSSSLTMRGPWPAPLRFGDVQSLCSQMLGIELSRSMTSLSPSPSLQAGEQYRQVGRAERRERGQRALVDSIRYHCRWPSDDEALRQIAQDASADDAREQRTRAPMNAQNRRRRSNTHSRRRVNADAPSSATENIREVLSEIDSLLNERQEGGAQP